MTTGTICIDMAEAVIWDLRESPHHAQCCRPQDP